MLHFDEGHRAGSLRSARTGIAALEPMSLGRVRTGPLAAALRALESFGRLLVAAALTHTQYRVLLYIGAKEEVGAEIEIIAEAVDLSLGQAAGVSRSLVRARLIAASAPGAPLRLTGRGKEVLSRLARRHLAALREAERRLSFYGRPN